jgi:hypothetical protein
LCGDVIDVAQGLVDQRCHVGVEEPVYDGAAIAVTDDQSEISQDPQLMGHSGLFHLELRAELADRARPDAEPGQYADAGRRSEGTHEPSDVLGVAP